MRRRDELFVECVWDGYSVVMGGSLKELDIALAAYHARTLTCEWEGDYCVESPAQMYEVLDPGGAIVLLNLCARCLHDEDGDE